MFLPDAGILIRVQRAGHLPALAAAAATAPMALAQEVYDELTKPRQGKHALLAKQAKQILDGSQIQLRSVQLGSPAATSFTRLRGNKTNVVADRGECASVALAIHDPTLRFVTIDRSMTFTALNELPGRVLTLHRFLRELVEGTHLARQAARDIADTVRPQGGMHAPEPEWWAAWI